MRLANLLREHPPSNRKYLPFFRELSVNRIVRAISCVRNSTNCNGFMKLNYSSNCRLCKEPLKLCKPVEFRLATDAVRMIQYLLDSGNN